MRASKLECALSHPDIAVNLAGDEKVIVAELTGWAWDLAVVGGHVGHRGPLVLCDAVKARKPELPTLVLVGQETDEAELTTHEERGLEEVRYLDLRGASASMAELKSARIMALEMLGIEENEGAAAEWTSRVEVLDGGEIGPDGEAEATEIGREAESVDSDAPPIVEPVTDEDIDFARRTVDQTRHVDFRSPASATAQTADAGDRQTAKLRDRVRELERNIARMAHVYGGRQREFDSAAERIADSEARNESLKRDLERLREHFAEERERWKANRAEVETKAVALNDRAQLLDGRLHDATEEVSRLRGELEQKEQSHAGVLTQAQEAFTTLKETTAQAIQNLDGQVVATNQAVADAREETSRVQRELERTREERAQQIETARADLQERIRELEHELDKAKQRYDAEVTARHERNEAHIAQLQEMEERSAEQRRMFEERVGHELNQRVVEVEELRKQLGEASRQRQELDAQLRASQEESVRQQDRAQQAQAQAKANQEKADRLETDRTTVAAGLQVARTELDAAHKELERLSGRATELEQLAVRARVDLEVANKEHATALERIETEHAELKAAASTFRDAHDERSTSAADLEAKVETLEAELASREQELAAITERQRDATKALERERSRSLETVLDARLAAVEEFARAASERIGEQHGVLALLEERSLKQERFVESLLDVDRPAPRTGRESAADDTPMVRRDTDEDLAKLARRLVDARVHEDAPRQTFIGWLRESPIHMLGIVFCVVVVVAALAVWLRNSVFADDTAVATDAVAAADVEDATEPVDAIDVAGEAPDEAEPAEPTEPAGETEPITAAEPPAPFEETVGVKRELTPKETAARRALRNTFFDAYRTKKWVKAVQLGTRLRDETYLDWESHFRLADAMRRSGELDRAVTFYNAFISEYPENVFADEAQLRTAQLLVKLDRADQAVPLYERLAADPKSKFRKPAKQALKSLER